MFSVFEKLALELDNAGRTAIIDHRRIYSLWSRPLSIVTPEWAHLFAIISPEWRATHALSETTMLFDAVMKQDSRLLSADVMIPGCVRMWEDLQWAKQGRVSGGRTPQLIRQRGVDFTRPMYSAANGARFSMIRFSYRENWFSSERRNKVANAPVTKIFFFRGSNVWGKWGERFSFITCLQVNF
jgi:hypothetical protein